MVKQKSYNFTLELVQLLGLLSKLSKFVLDLSDSDFDNVVECLLEGPTIQRLVRSCQKKFNGKPNLKFNITSGLTGGILQEWC